MKNIFLVTAIILIFFYSGCEKVTDPVTDVDSFITAKTELTDVLQKAKTDFAADAKLAAIYGWNVSKAGKIDLLSTENAFVYGVQSNQLKRNEFYVPVYLAGPVKSPINFSTMLALVKDNSASNILGKVFNRLSTISIDASANYKDSPATIDTALAHGGSSFIQQNAAAKIDMYLVPSKSIDTLNGFVNSADWIVNFYTSTKSFVIWINSASGTVTKLSEN